MADFVEIAISVRSTTKMPNRNSNFKFFESYINVFSYFALKQCTMCILNLFSQGLKDLSLVSIILLPVIHGPKSAVKNFAFK